MLGYGTESKKSKCQEAKSFMAPRPSKSMRGEEVIVPARGAFASGPV